MTCLDSRPSNKDPVCPIVRIPAAEGVTTILRAATLHNIEGTGTKAEHEVKKNAACI